MITQINNNCNYREFVFDASTINRIMGDESSIMIETKKELNEYIEQDAKANRITDIKKSMRTNVIWKFIVLTRKLDYTHYRRNQSHFYSPIRLYYRCLRRQWDKLALKCGFSMSYRNIGKGFSIAHYGQLAINGGCVIGNNFRVHEGVTLGSSGGGAPYIGNNVFIGTGAKVIGEITIADDVCIGAGAVVVRSITEKGTTWAGNPARKISDKNSHKYLSPLLNLDQ